MTNQKALTKALIVGDPHITIQKLEDGKVFLNRLAELSEGHDQVIILGDLFHTFALVRSEVMAAWCEFLQKCKCDVTAIVGNHDYAGQTGGNHALEPFKYFQGRALVNVVDKPFKEDGIHYLPFMRNNNVFEEECRKIPDGSVLICHQSFHGAEFGSGYFDPNGADPTCVQHLSGVISGHIHKRQAFANIWYPGVPFQHSFSDAGYDCKVFSVNLENNKYSITKEHDLGLPRFEIISGAIDELVDLLPEPNPTSSYKIVSKGSPQEIADFWKNPKVKNFRKKSRRVVDALVPERGEIPHEMFRTSQDGKDKIETFIRAKRWRSPTDSVLAAARAIFAKRFDGTILR